MNETKIDESIQHTFFANPNYKIIRHDRNKAGGGIIVFIRQEYKVIKTVLLNNIEAIYYQLLINSTTVNFISCYKAPVINDISFLDSLEDFIYTLNLDDDLVIIGDLNMNLLEERNLNSNLIEFLFNNNLKQLVTEPTRICSKYYERSNNFSCSKSLIDVVIHNNNLVQDTQSIHCPFSDHNFIVGTLDCKKANRKSEYFIGRNLLTNNVQLITEKLLTTNFNGLHQASNVNDRWLFLRSKILSIVDSVAPEKKITVRNQSYFPWIDVELTEAKNDRDKAYKEYKKTLC